MLTVTSTAIDAVKVVTPKLIADSRGTFCETYNQGFAEHGILANFVQDNESASAAIGTIRGLHFQGHPAAQAKLIRVLKGRIFDVAVDLRRS
jgi:dTDP-4-dehydrorhamnose 3,5-epimerase